MNPKRVLAITRKTLTSLRHDPRSVALMLIAPIMAMLIFGFAFSGETKHVPVTIVNDDAGPLAATLVAKLDHEALDIATSKDAAGARQEVLDGHRVATLTFPANFSQQAASGRDARIGVFLDTTNAALSAVVLRQIAEAGQTLVRESGGSLPVSIDASYAHPEAKDARVVDSFVPGIMAFAVTLFTTLLTLLAFVNERVSGTLDRLRVTPVTEAEIVLGYELAFGLIATVQGILLLSVAVLAYHVLVVGPVLVAGLIIVLLAIDAQAIGILISAGARREGQAVQMIPFIILPVFLLSGIFVPLESLPAWLRPFSYVLPPTWGIEAMRDVTLRGWGLERVWIHVAVLAGFALVFSVLAILGLRRARSA
jgi:ABC-2 type transport system permease protein